MHFCIGCITRFLILKPVQLAGKEHEENKNKRILEPTLAGRALWDKAELGRADMQELERFHLLGGLCMMIIKIR